MAEIKLTLSTANINRVKVAFASAYNYNDTKKPGETVGAFAKRMVVQFVKGTVKHQEKSAQGEIDLAAHRAGYTEPEIT